VSDSLQPTADSRAALRERTQHGHRLERQPGDLQLDLAAQAKVELRNLLP
jgi:hypothetical protein